MTTPSKHPARPTRYPGERSRVEPITGEPFRFHVQSRTRTEVMHLVDIEENDFHGQCSCESFAFRMQPLLDRGERGDHLRCSHLNAARMFLLDVLLERIKKYSREDFLERYCDVARQDG